MSGCKLEKESTNPLAERNLQIISGLTWWDIQVTLSHFLYCFGDAFVHYMIAVRMNYINLSHEEIVIVMSAGGLIGLTRMIPALCD